MSPRDNLAASLDLLSARRIVPDVLLLTGDLADEGEPSCYADLAELVSHAAARAGALAVFVPGNHDARPAFREELLGEAPSEDPINQVHRRDGLRIVSLDSSVPGEEWGELEESTLGFLRHSLAEPAPDGTLLVLHHPPVSSPIKPMSRIALRNAAPLADAIVGSDVRLVVCGHNHHEAMGTLSGIPVWVSPATAYRADVSETEVFRAYVGVALSRIDLGPEGPLATVLRVPV